VTVQYAIHTEVDEGRLAQVVALHDAALSYRSFITSFGRPFLTRLYEDILGRRLGFLVIAQDAGRVAGFVLATTDAAHVMSAVLSRPLVYARHLLPTLVRRPRLVVDCLSVLAYPKKVSGDENAELLVIAVAEDMRSRRVGQHLLKALEGEFLRRGVVDYRVTVHDEMQGANRFYVSNGATFHHSFRMRGVLWNTYVRHLGENRKDP
jgi:ribosomal protein S18 acetylase RimI-like enzyme